MKTNHQQKRGVRFYGSLILTLLLAITFISFSAVNLHPAPRTGGVRLNPVIRKVQQIYTSQIGIREKHNNSGPQVEEYLRYVNLPKGNPWCAAFVCWVFGKAGVGNPRSGWSPALFGEGRIIWERGERGKVRGEPRAKNQEPRPLQSETSPFYLYADTMRPAWQLATGNWQPPKNPGQPTISNPNLPVPNTGDVFALYFPEKRRIAHVGFIDQWDGTWMISVEGNTNVNGSREGDGVYRKRRAVRSVYKVARYIK